jgi:hypothetical protein
MNRKTGKRKNDENGTDNGPHHRIYFSSLIMLMGSTAQSGFYKLILGFSRSTGFVREGYNGKNHAILQ